MWVGWNCFFSFLALCYTNNKEYDTLIHQTLVFIIHSIIVVVVLVLVVVVVIVPCPCHPHPHHPHLNLSLIIVVPHCPCTFS